MVRCIIFFFFLPACLFAQTVIYSENFSSYAEGTGIDYSGNIGDYPSAVSQWSLSVGSALLVNGNDYFKTIAVYSNLLLEARDTDGDVIWESSEIDIGGYENVYFSMDISETGTLEDDDYCQVYYRVDNGDYNLISNWNSTSLSEYTLNNDWTSETILVKVEPAETLQLKVVFNNGADTEKMRLDNVEVSSHPGTVWNGNGDWSEEAYWSNGLPENSSEVTINSGACFVDNDYEIFALTINENSSIHINPTTSLVVNSILTNTGGVDGLIVHSDSNGTGELVHSSEHVFGRVEQFISGNSTGSSLQYWHYISLPVKNIDSIENTFSGDYLIMYQEESDSWSYLASGDTLNQGIGYGLWSERDTVISFQGELNSGEILPPISYTDEWHGWNFIGNPYPSTIDLELLDYSGMDHEVHVWNPAAKNYSSYNIGTNGSINGGTRYIAPMQGFFMLATDESAELTFADDIKKVGRGSFKDASIPQEILLEAWNKKGSDEVLIQINPLASFTFDEPYDVHKFVSSGSAPSIYIKDEGINLAIKAIPFIDSQLRIQLELQVDSTDHCNLSLKKITGLKNLEQLILIDNQTGFRKDLLKEPCLIVHGGISHFLLEFETNTVNTEMGNLPVHIYTDNGSVVIESYEENWDEIRIIDMNGKILRCVNKKGNSQRIGLYQKGVFLVEVKAANKREIRKIIL